MSPPSSTPRIVLTDFLSGDEHEIYSAHHSNPQQFASDACNYPRHHLINTNTDDSYGPPPFEAPSLPAALNRSLKCGHFCSSATPAVQISGDNNKQSGQPSLQIASSFAHPGKYYNSATVKVGCCTCCIEIGFRGCSLDRRQKAWAIQPAAKIVLAAVLLCCCCSLAALWGYLGWVEGQITRLTLP